MCHNLLLYLVNLKNLNFLKEITSQQQGIYIGVALLLGIVGLTFIEYIYNSTGIIKLLIFLVIIIFLIGSILNGLKIIIDSQGDYRNKYMVIYYCIQFVGIMIALIYFIFKFMLLASLLLFG